MSWIICRVSMSCRRSVPPSPGRKRMSFQWVLHPPAMPRPQSPGTSPLLTLRSHPPGSPEGSAGSVRRGQGLSRSPQGPGLLTVPILEDDAHAALAACLLVAVHDPQRLHLGVHEGALFHTAGHRAVSRGPSAGLGGQEEARAGAHQTSASRVLGSSGDCRWERASR